MLLGVIFWVNSERFNQVRKYLIEKYRLRPPTLTNGCIDTLFVDTHLVYEDPDLVQGDQKGVYRVNFDPNHRLGPYIGFRYYERRLNPDIMEKDPMRKVVCDVYNMLRPVKVTDWGCKPIDLDQLCP